MTMWVFFTCPPMRTHTYTMLLLLHFWKSCNGAMYAGESRSAVIIVMFKKFGDYEVPIKLHSFLMNLQNIEWQTLSCILINSKERGKIRVLDLFVNLFTSSWPLCVSNDCVSLSAMCAALHILRIFSRFLWERARRQRIFGWKRMDFNALVTDTGISQREAPIISFFENYHHHYGLTTIPSIPQPSFLCVRRRTPSIRFLGHYLTESTDWQYLQSLNRPSCVWEDKAPSIHFLGHYPTESTDWQYLQSLNHPPCVWEDKLPRSISLDSDRIYPTCPHPKKQKGSSLVGI